MLNEKIKARLDYLRQEIEAERISQAEILELESLKAHIDPADTLLLQWAGVPENNNFEDPRPVKCNWCEWKGNENQLIVKDEKEYCPSCDRNGHIMDIE